MKRWKKIASTYILKTPWLALRKDAYKTPNGKVLDDFYIVERENFVVVVPMTTKGEYLLVEQYRHGPERKILNFPMGFIKKGESPRQAALRELREETDYSTKNIEYVGSFLLSPTFTNMTGYVFLAPTVKELSGHRGTDPDEEVISIKAMSEKSVRALIKKRAQTDFVTACAFLLQNESETKRPARPV